MRLASSYVISSSVRLVRLGFMDLPGASTRWPRCSVPPIFQHLFGFLVGCFDVKGCPGVCPRWVPMSHHYRGRPDAQEEYGCARAAPYTVAMQAGRLMRAARPPPLLRQLPAVCTPPLQCRTLRRSTASHAGRASTLRISSCFRHTCTGRLTMPACEAFELAQTCQTKAMSF